ncbi:MAG: antibiotic biosynthesis monooxygenase [Acidobacteriales bacterium]|nr:antibiotic biosynthesis monooxygenase [Terriglobales bacterium]
MNKLGLYVHLEAKPGKEHAVEDFLRSALPLVQQETGTLSWYAIRMGPTSFGIFDTFSDDSGREAHLNGKVAAALMEKAPELLAQQPRIEKVEVLVEKLPGSSGS